VFLDHIVGNRPRASVDGEDWRLVSAHFDFFEFLLEDSSPDPGRDLPNEIHSSLKSEAMRNLAVTACGDMSTSLLFGLEGFDVS
jgi:hypothetical protein